MTRHLVLPLVALAMLVFAAGHPVYIQQPEPEAPPPMPPPATPFGNTVAGAGMVEPSTEASGTSAIAIGSQVAGVVVNVPVHLGQEVKCGDLLFELDRRPAEASLRALQAALVLAQQNLRKLELQPRPEEVPVYEAQLAVAEASERQQRDVFDRDRRLPLDVVDEETRIAHRQAWELARAQVQLARANLALEKAGAWQPDKAIAVANVEQARAQVEQGQVALDLLRVQAPVGGTVLQINVRVGEYVSTFGGQSLILMGNLRPLHVRVNVDEEDVPRLRLYAPARARLRGDANREEIPLTFVRLEPYVIPKTSLTGVNTERVDTRVAQVIYALDPRHRLVQEKKVLVGQLVDVFIDTGLEGPTAEQRQGQRRDGPAER
jgi:HlyD family secretion protein